MRLGGGTAAGRPDVSRLRLAVGLAAAATTVPYLTLKGLWLAGSTLGMADPEFFQNSTYFVANLLTFGLDAITVGIAFALTYPWGRRLPAWLVLVPMWVATGFLATIAVLLPLAAPLAGRTPAGSGPDPLESWVYAVVYCGFAAQGLLILTAFALYSRQRWPAVFAGRNDEVVPGATHALQSLLTAVGSALAAGVGAGSLGLALGGAGMPAGRTAVDRVTLGVYGAFALAAAAGLPMLVHRRPRRAKVWLPLVLTWAGTGSMIAWGLYFLAIAAADPTLSTPALSLLTEAKVVAAVLLGVVGAFLLVERSGPQPAQPAHRDRVADREDRADLPVDRNVPADRC